MQIIITRKTVVHFVYSGILLGHEQTTKTLVVFKGVHNQLEND